MTRSLLVLSGGHPYEAEPFAAMIASLEGWTVTHLIHPEAERLVGEGGAQLGQWAAQGKLVVDEHIDEGIDNAYPAFMRLFAGTNQGKMILKLA